MASSNFTAITPIPERSDATPGLWNTRYSVIDGNFGSLADRVTNTGVENVRDYPYLARGDTVTDDTAKIQAAITAAGANGVVYVPKTGLGLYYKITIALLMPRVNGICIRGDGFQCAQIQQLDTTKNLIDSIGTFAGSGVNRWVLENLWLEGGASTVRLEGVLRSRLSRLFISGVPTGTGAGLEVINSHLTQLDNSHIEACYDGFRYTYSAPGTGWNGASIRQTTFENCTRYGIYFVNAGAGVSIENATVETCRFGGLMLGQDVHAMHIHGGSYFEGNTNGVDPSADIYAGLVSPVRGVTIEGNHFNGRDPGATYDYAPLKVGYATGLVFRHNTLFIGNVLVKFVNPAGGSMLNCRFGPNTFTQPGIATDISDPRTVYKDIPADFVTNGNSIDEPSVVPLLPGNYLTGDLPFGWTPSLGAGSAFVKAPGSGSSAVAFRGRKATATLTKGSGAAQIAQTVTISGTNNTELRNRYVTFAVPVLCTTAAAATVSLTVNPDGTGAALASSNAVPLNLADGWRVYYCTGFVPSDATLVIVTIVASTAASYHLGKPLLYVGVGPVPEDSEGVSLPPVWRSSTVIPTTGTWEVGDTIVNTSGVPGQPLSAECITAGTPGTWRIKGWVPGSFGDNTNTSIVLTATTESTLRYDTALTANRTVTLPTRAASVTGQKFRVVRTGLGAFTLSVQEDAGDGGTVLKVIPILTAAFIDVEFDTGGTSVWRLTAYGTLD